MFGSGGIGARQCKGPEVGVTWWVQEAGQRQAGEKNENRRVSGPDHVDLVGFYKDLGSYSESHIPSLLSTAPWLGHCQPSLPPSCLSLLHSYVESIVMCINSAFLILAEQYSVVWINLCVFIHSPIDGPLVYFQFLIITKK